LIGDFSLNAANAISCQLLLDLGLDRITPTYDLNGQQISELVERFPGSALEVIAYSHLPVFHTEHCVFCRFLSEGTDHTNCGHPCEKHRVAVRDHQGRSHPVMADVGCRNTIFGAQAQVDPDRIEQWRTAGISRFRLEFVHQNAAQVQGIISAFSRHLVGRLSTREFRDELTLHSPEGITQGSLFVPDDYKQLVQLR
jgi:putative protease